MAVEEPLEIRAGRKPICVVMRTPGHDQELAAGFLLTEGFIRGAQDVSGIRPLMRKENCNIINVSLNSSGRGVPSRGIMVSSSCGICGKASIDAVHLRFPPITDAPGVKAGDLMALPEKLRKEQAAFARTGGLHAAALFTIEGDLVVVREDAGRHNAVDKVVGHALMAKRLPLDRHILMVSGRASFEIVQKALAARIPVVAAVSAPSSLAAEFAEQSGLALIGFLREGRLNVYSHPERVTH